MPDEQDTGKVDGEYLLAATLNGVDQEGQPTQNTIWVHVPCGCAVFGGAKGAHDEWHAALNKRFDSTALGIGPVGFGGFRV